MILTGELVIVGLASPLRQLHVQGVENIAHGHGVTIAARARGIKVAPRDAWDVKEEMCCASRYGGLVHRVGVAGWMEARR